MRNNPAPIMPDDFTFTSSISAAIAWENSWTVIVNKIGRINT